jgi:hypothetical protein
MAEKPFILNLGQSRLIIDPNIITPEKIDILSDNLGKVKLKHSIFTKYPLLDDENTEQWQERVLPLMGEETKKKEGESAEDYLSRVFKPDQEKRAIMYDTCIAVADSFERGGAVSPEVLKKVVYGEIKAFLVGVLKHCDLGYSEFE